jgi:hypothetical protein
MNLPSTIVFLLLLGIEPIGNTASAETLLDAQQGFTTTLAKKDVDGAPVPDPPRNVLQSVKYNSPIGDLAAYITPSPQDGKRHPAIIWIFGGFSNSIDETAWASATPDNDQSASTYFANTCSALHGQKVLRAFANRQPFGRQHSWLRRRPRHFCWLRFCLAATCPDPQ